MSGLKLPLIFLLFVVVLFFVFAYTGSKKNNSSKPGDKPADAEGFNADDYPVIKSLGSVLGAFSPKLTVKQIQPALAAFNLQSQANYTLTIAADPKNKFRSAKFRVPATPSKRCAHLEYKPAEPPPETLASLNDQDSEKQGKADQAKPKPEVSLTILSSGGTIRIDRNSGFNGPCIVQLEQ